MSMNALQGIRVLDLSHVIAGPTASHYLALQGAEVIKVEPPGKGDTYRWGKDSLDQGVSVGFAAINGGKQSLALDLKNLRAKELFTELIGQADVFIENYRPGAVARLGFDYEQVRAIRPDIVYASISGFGQEGEWATRPAYDHVVQSAMGMGWLQGEAEQDPVKVGFPVIDSATGMIAAQGILAALFRRERQGKGAYLDISMAQAALQLMWPTVSKVGMSGQDASRVGNRGFSGSPGAASFACADGWISIAANTAVQFQTLCHVLGVPDLTLDETLIDQVALKNGGFLVALSPERIHSLLSDSILKFKAEELEVSLSSQAVPCAILRPLSQVLPELMNGGRMTLPLRQTAYPGGMMRDFGSGYQADTDPGHALAPAPRLGQHTRLILQSLKVSEEEIAQLAARGVIRLEAKDEKIARNTYNSRSETAAEKSS
jgi:crotonobetainyl-CoA:carnitine CoA-transferase CaiB-like acyl-CoA transferase